MSTKAERAFRSRRVIMPVKIRGQWVNASVKVQKPRRRFRKAAR